MKRFPIKVLLMAVLTVLISSSFAQEMSKQDYLALSKRQKNTGLILLGGGAAVATAGAIIFNENFCLWGCSNSEDALAGTGAAMFVGGGIAMIASIPYFISSSKNANRAAQFGLVREYIPGPRLAYHVPRSYPALRISIPIHSRD